MGRWLCLFGAGIGAIGLLGWVTGISILFWIPGMPPMMPNTAIALLLAGIAGALRSRQQSGWAARIVMWAATLLVLIIGVGTLAEYSGIDIDIDQAILRSSMGPHPGRPSPPTALALTLLAMALIVFDVQLSARVRLPEVLILGAGFIAYTSMVGYVFGAGPLYRMTQAPVIGVAVPTALSLLLIAVGLLFFRPSMGIMPVAMSPGPGGLFFRRFVLAVLLLPPLLGLGTARLLTVLGFQDFALLVAALSATMSLIGLLLIAITAHPLDAMHEALVFSRNRIKDLIDQASDGVFIADIDGRYIDVNAAACQLTGYPREELIEKSIVDLIPPAESKRLGQEKDRLLEGASLVSEWNLRRKDGTFLPVEVSAKILPDGRWQAFVRDISERKRAENALRESEAKFSGILAISADAIISIDEEQRITMFNGGAENIFGYTKDEMLGAPIDILIPERFREGHREQVRRFEESRQIARGMGERGRTIIGRRKNGEEFPADASISKLEINGRKILTVALRDISEQMRIQEQLRLSQERFELALRGADLGAWDWNVKTGKVVFNSHWAEMRGYRLEEIRPHVDTWRSGIHPDDLQRVQKALSDHFQGLTPEYEAEHRVLTREGNWIWILDRGKVFLRDEHGQPTRMVGTEFDITERKRAENELNFLAEVGPVVAASLDYEETLSRVAQMAVRDFADFCIVDIVEEDCSVRRLKVACRDPSKNWICEGLARIALGPTPRLTVTAMVRKQSVLMERVSPEELAAYAQSEEHLNLMRAAEIHSVIAVPLMAREKFLGAIAFTSSSQTYSQADLRLAEELARRAALSLENARLYRAAGRAIQARDDVLGIVAHDLRNPLGIIMMHAKLLQRRGAEPERRLLTSIEAIGRAATRMNRLIQDLLDVSRIEAGSLAIEPARVPVEQVLEDALDAQRALAASAGLELRIDLAQELPEVWADRSRLLQILENLIGNALKFTPSGGRITVGAALKDNEIVFRVEDTGSGIPAENLSHIFDRFWQAKKSDRGGAGLGLSIVKGLVEAHKGRICVESVPGQGSTFYFTLPTEPCAAPAVRH